MLVEQPICSLVVTKPRLLLLLSFVLLEQM
jgi:hypothetical protein